MRHDGTAFEWMTVAGEGGGKRTGVVEVRNEGKIQDKRRLWWPRALGGSRGGKRKREKRGGRGGRASSICDLEWANMEVSVPRAYGLLVWSSPAGTGGLVSGRPSARCCKLEGIAQRGEYKMKKG